MAKLQMSALLMAALVSVSFADAFLPQVHPAREMSVLATVNERTQKTLPTQRFSTPATTEEEAVSPPTVEDADEFKLYRLPATRNPLIEVSLPTVASIFLATFGTFLLNNVANLGPVKASSIAGLLSTLLLPEKLALTAFCGSFAGMAKMAVIPGLIGGATLGVSCAAMLTFFDNKKWLVGVGGRLGFIAQCACTTQYLISSLFLGPTSPTVALIGSGPLDLMTLTRQLPKVAGFTVVGALFMRFWKQVLADKSKRLSTSVGAVSLSGLLAAYALPSSMAGAVYCGSFVAMSAPAKLATTKALVLASILAGAAQQSLAGVMLGGWGGKLGTAALMGVLAYTLLDRPQSTKTDS